MVELFYFSGLGLMIKVEYDKKANSIRYASHREMENNERVMAEQYIMVKVVPKANYHHTHSSKFVYLGTDERLKKNLTTFHRQNDLKLLTTKEKEITETVNNLIKVSMLNYYTEKIGELIMTVRDDLKNGRLYELKLVHQRRQMMDLLDAYNIYSDHKIALSEIIPLELKRYWPNLEDARCYNISPSHG